MTIRKDGAVLRHLNTLFNIGVTRELTDGQLLERFSTGPSEIAELAFEALVERHGAMVLRVCRAQLADPDDTHDAFQATFLILVKKARSLWVRDSLGPWLHQVAFRTASCARSASARRRKHERRAAEMATLDTHENRLAPDWENILHEEINRLPECYRVPIVLCDLQGCTCEEVARRMGRPVGTVKSWRSRGRERLRDRLIRRGLTPSTALGTALAQDIARAAVSEESLRLAVRALSDGMTAGEVSASVHTLVKGVLKTMLLSKLQTTATAVFASVFLTAGLGTIAWVVAGDSHRPVGSARAEPEPPRPAVADRPHRTSGPSSERVETWPLTLRQAIHIGLENAGDIRLVSIGTPFKIAPIKTAVDPHEFKAEAIAKVRSIEQQYWSLAQVHAQVEANKKSVELAEEILKRETAELAAGRGTVADVAECTQRLEQLKLDLATRSSDVITTEHQLRNLLGMPSVDGRTIVPVTAPVEAQLEPDWEVSLAAMLENQPEIVQAKARVKQAEAARTGTVASRLAEIESQKDSLKWAVHRHTHSLARFFLEIDANYKQFRTASRLREAASGRLDAQRAYYYEEGRITIDRFLDAVSQYGAAIATEAQYKTTYNNSIVALEEAKGTLLEYDQITVLDGPQPTLSFVTAPFFRSAPLAPPSPQPPGPSPNVSPPAPLTTIEPRPNAAPFLVDPSAGKTFSFDLTVGIGSMPVQIRGSFTITPARSAAGPKVQ